MVFQTNAFVCNCPGLEILTYNFPGFVQTLLKNNAQIQYGNILLVIQLQHLIGNTET